MRNLAFIFAISLSAFFSCEKPNPNLTDTSPLTHDTVLVAEIDTLLEKNMHSILRQGGFPTETTMLFEGDTVDMSYYDLENGYARWDLKVAPPGFDRYATFYLKDEEPIMFRFREWTREGNVGAGEIIVYIKDGKIFYAKERSMPLAAGQSPALLHDKGHRDSEWTRKDLWELMQTYYPSMKGAWDKRKK